MGFSDFLNSVLGMGPTRQADERINIGRSQQMARLQQEYEQAQADPNAGIGLSPAMQQMQENELVNSVRSRMSNAGAGRSGAANDSVQKAIVDYRIAQMAQRRQYLDSLRSAMLTSSTPQTVQPTLPQEMVGGFAGRASQGLASDLFGFDQDDERNYRGGMNVQPPQPTTAYGYDPRGQGPNGPNGRGANNAESYGP